MPFGGYCCLLFCLTCFVRAEEVQFEEAPKSPRAIPSVTGTQLLRTNKTVRQKSKQQYPPKGMYHWGTDEKKRVRGCPSCPYNIKVGRCEVGLRKFPKITAVRRWYSSFGWNFRHNTTEWTFKNVVLAFQNVLTFENSLWWRLLVNDQKMGSQKLGAYEVRYKWKIQKSMTSVNIYRNS